MQTQQTDQQNLEAFVGRVLGDVGAIMSGALVVLGDRLGLYKSLQRSGPTTPEALAGALGLSARLVREWLAGQTAAGYVTLDDDGRYRLTAEQAAVFADERSPTYLGGGFYAAASFYTDEPKVAEAFRHGHGVAWGAHAPTLYVGTEKLFAPAYRTQLVSSWLPALDGIVPRLERGARVADVGAGFGTSTVVMAEAFPRSRFVGFDAHGPSVEEANRRARERGLDNLRFEVAAAQQFPGEGYDLVTVFDALHDMGDPVGALRQIRRAIAADGICMVVEPFAGDHLEENLTTVGRMFYAASTMVCTPSAQSDGGHMTLGAQAGERRLSEVAFAGGFSRFRRAAETPFNLILELRP